MLSDIKNYIYNQNNPGLTTQSQLGMKYLFRGWVTKNWTNINDPQNVIMKEINRILVRQSVEYYSEAWKQRNDLLHDPNYYKQYIVDWYNNVKNMITNEERMQVQTYLRTQPVDVNCCDASYIKSWILGILQMRKIVKESKRNDIRKYFLAA